MWLCVAGGDAILSGTVPSVAHAGSASGHGAAGGAWGSQRSHLRGADAREHHWADSGGSVPSLPTYGRAQARHHDGSPDTILPRRLPVSHLGTPHVSGSFSETFAI